MDEDQLFSVGVFAELSRTTRDTLHHYDEIGLLPPAKRGKNNYRYYSASQLAIINVIRILQELGMSLEEIIEVKAKRTPDYLKKLYGEQIDKIDATIAKWLSARKLLLTTKDLIDSVEGVDEGEITIQYLPVSAMIMGRPNDFGDGRHAYSELLNFYKSMHRKYPELDLNYPVWGVFSQDRIKNRDWIWPDRYYFCNPDGFDRRPAALYAIGYARGGYGQTGELYERMLHYIYNNGFEICGNSYEEYPLNELTISDPNNYLIRVLITVRAQNES